MTVEWKEKTKTWDNPVPARFGARPALSTRLSPGGPAPGAQPGWPCALGTVGLRPVPWGAAARTDPGPGRPLCLGRRPCRQAVLPGAAHRSTDPGTDRRAEGPARPRAVAVPRGLPRFPQGPASPLA